MSVTAERTYADNPRFCAICGHELKQFTDSRPQGYNIETGQLNPEKVTDRRECWQSMHDKWRLVTGGSRKGQWVLMSGKIARQAWGGI